ncbi:MAG: hypothetical protein JNL10_11860 [Verrucomicrobiales bacterium]|nr:hypothetical protein [Verrucomicrobiales bacterium]
MSDQEKPDDRQQPCDTTSLADVRTIMSQRPEGQGHSHGQLSAEDCKDGQQEAAAD